MRYDCRRLFLRCKDEACLSLHPQPSFFLLESLKTGAFWLPKTLQDHCYDTMDFAAKQYETTPSTFLQTRKECHDTHDTPFIEQRFRQTSLFKGGKLAQSRNDIGKNSQRFLYFFGRGIAGERKTDRTMGAGKRNLHGTKNMGWLKTARRTR